MEKTPTKVSLKDLARVSNLPTPSKQSVAAIERVLGRKPVRTTPGGLPSGFQWKPHDTGRLGYAAARRLRQMERQREKAQRRQGA